jgi:ferredoxin-NADP reductase/ferredoxin
MPRAGAHGWMGTEETSLAASSGTSPCRVTLRFDDGVEKEVEVRANEFVLDGALRQGVPLVHQCRSGSCSTCVAQMIDGSLEMARDRAIALISSEIAEGKRLLCSSYALAPSIVRLHYPSSLIYGEPSRNFKARVLAVEWPAASVARLSIVSDSRDGISFHPGQYARLRVPGTDQWRSYSMCSIPRDLPKMEFLVRMIPGGAMSEYLKSASGGEALEVEGPLGAFVLHPARGLHIFVAGGTGLSPILAMIDQLRRASGPKPRMLLSFGCASDSTFFYRDEIELRQWWIPQLSVRLSADLVEDPACGLIPGTPVDALGSDPITDPDASAYLCGPPAMIEAARRRLAELGVSPERIYAERFVAS